MSTLFDIKMTLLHRLRGMIERDELLFFRDRPSEKPRALNALVPARFKVVVTRDPLAAGPEMYCGAMALDKEKADGMRLWINQKEWDAVLKDVTPEDMKLLLEDAARDNVNRRLDELIAMPDRYPPGDPHCNRNAIQSDRIRNQKIAVQEAIDVLRAIHLSDAKDVRSCVTCA